MCTPERPAAPTPTPYAFPFCPTCGAPPREQEVRNFDRVSRIGEVYCCRCGIYVRDFDPT